VFFEFSQSVFVGYHNIILIHVVHYTIFFEFRKLADNDILRADSMHEASKRFLPLVITLAVIAVVGVFVFRVVLIYNKIQSGEINSSLDLGFGDSITTSPRLAQISNGVNPDEFQSVETTDDPSIGDADSKLTIVEFIDYGCEFCREASFSVRTLTMTYADRVRYIVRDFPVTELHPNAQIAAEASECAWAQDEEKFWAYHDILFQNQTDLSRPALREYARTVGLDVPAFDQCLASGKYRQEVLKDFEDGVGAGVVGTPTFFFNDQKVSGAIPSDTFREIIEAYLR
jgi:protein-disulfide isomerase